MCDAVQMGLARNNIQEQKGETEIDPGKMVGVPRIEHDGIVHEFDFGVH